MNRKDKKIQPASEAENLETLSPELRGALGDFKLTVDAWSESMTSRPRQAATPAQTNWSLITKWALGCAVFGGTVSSGVYQNHRQVEAAKLEAARIAEQQRASEAAKVTRNDEEDLMANVDSDVARQVPSALQPLATLMTEDETTGN